MRRSRFQSSQRAARLTDYLKPYLLKMQFCNRLVRATVIYTPNDAVAVQASSSEKQLRKTMKSTGDVSAASRIGQILALRLLQNDVPAVSVHYGEGQRYHGKLKALLDSLRDSGVKLI